MPLRLCHFSPRQPPRFLHLPPSIRAHAFSASAFCLAANHGPTYYEILDVPVTATAAEIKKQFYSLSLQHHPDRNQKDPKAAGTFASISSAYQVLGNASKRARYDRDNNIHRPPDTQHNHHYARHTHPTHHHHHQGSFSSSSASSYAGSRPASGLSKRRGPFRGPPPSFYAHGGHNRASGNGPETSTSSSSSSSSSSHTTTNKTSYSYSYSSSSSSSKEDPTSFITHNPIPHFNARSHFRTQSLEDARRISRRKRAVEEEKARRRAMGEDVDSEGVEGSHLARFLVVGGMLTVAGVVGSVMRSVSEAGPAEKKKKKVG